MSCDELALFLSFAVPMWMDRVREWPDEHLRERARICSQVIAEQGDVIQFYVPGQSGPAATRLAEGLAICAFQPGGVRILGMHFEEAE